MDPLAGANLLMLKTTKSNIGIIAILLALSSSWLPGAPAAEPADRSKQFMKLAEDAHQAQVDFVTQIRAATSGEERERLIATIQPGKLFGQKFYDLAKEHPEDSVAEQCCLWVMSSGPSPQLMEDVLALMLKYHSNGQIMAGVCVRLERAQTPAADQFLRDVLKKTSDPGVRAAANMTLAKRAEQTSPAEAEKYIRQAIEDCKSSAAPPYAQSMLQVAQQALFELQNLGIGKTAPEIKGVDVQGNALSSSDFKGKILLVDFFGDW